MKASVARQSLGRMDLLEEIFIPLDLHVESFLFRPLRFFLSFLSLSFFYNPDLDKLILTIT